MSRIKIILLAFTLALLFSGCVENSAVVEGNGDQIDGNPDQVDETFEEVDENTGIINENKTEIPENTINANSVEDYDIAAANNAFAFDMYSQLTQPEAGEYENILFSPHSICAAMAICYEGAEDTTKEQISNVFYFPIDKKVLREGFKDANGRINSGNDNYELKTANALWAQEGYPVKEEYIYNVKNYYDGKVTNLDFVGKPDDSIDAINEWVEDKTNNKIRDLVPENSIRSDTRIIITNAIYFNGKWRYVFDKELTEKGPFYPAEGEKISVDMMHIAENFAYGENPEAKIIELPYRGNDLSMYIVLPKKNDIGKFEAEFTLNNYTELKKGMGFTAEVETSIPKFKFETKTELSDSLIKMGAVDAFGPANFTGISDSPLKVSEVIHQTFIDVYEEGTEAAASTMVGVDECCASSDIKEFKADHPFMFFIEDRRTNCILFMGKVEYPEYENDT
ncbi:serpin family protein [Methanosarcina mazei]|uniref:Serine protease inhibitor (Serpin family) n=1 Tax=Methanosarcina mazei SarPi TaxID=1434115 RepID=A0A0E3RCQ5_METMZ|nr:serpin family protein [Methanosarcina mazei]AKB61882.1 Serine protease inhibitor (serpin family) [Methanosarcina mazei SarPi]